MAAPNFPVEQDTGGLVCTTGNNGNTGLSSTAKPSTLYFRSTQG